MGFVWALVTHTSCKHVCGEKYSMCVMLHTEILVLSVNEVPFLGK